MFKFKKAITIGLLGVLGISFASAIITTENNDIDVEETKAATISTIGDVFDAFAPSFPRTESDGEAANPWKSGGEARCWIRSGPRLTFFNEMEYVDINLSEGVNEEYYGYGYNNLDSRIEFHIDGDKLTSIVTSGFDFEMCATEGTYISNSGPVPPPITVTIGEVLATVNDGFPNSINDFIPGTAWRNVNNIGCYLYYSDHLVFGDMNDQYISLELYYELEEGSHLYVYEDYFNKIIFHTEFDILYAIEVQKCDLVSDDFKGTYLPSDSSINSVADIIATVSDFATSYGSDNAWINGGENVCFYDGNLHLRNYGIDYDVPGGATVSKVGDNYTLESYGTLLFEMVDDVLVSITYTSGFASYDELAGKYAKGYKINIVVNDSTMGVAGSEYQKAAADSQVRLFAHPSEGYQFVGWEADFAEFEITTGQYNQTFFTMPNHEVTLTAKFIEEDKIISIQMASNPTKTTYFVGEQLNLTGAKITVTMSSGITQDIDVTAEMVSGYNSNTLGQQTITVTYEGKTTTFQVTVISEPLPAPSTNRINGGGVAAIIVFSTLFFFIILFAVLYILWKFKNVNVPAICKILTPAFRWINNVFFGTELNNVEKKDAENRQMRDEDYLKALKEGTLK